MTTPSEWRTALDPLVSMLAADGYGVQLTGGDPLGIAIVAKDEACGDCLVPESVMRPQIADLLSAKGIQEEWTLSLPAAADTESRLTGRRGQDGGARG
jgi:hypothetical protein